MNYGTKNELCTNSDRHIFICVSVCGSFTKRSFKNYIYVSVKFFHELDDVATDINN